MRLKLITVLIANCKEAAAREELVKKLWNVYLHGYGGPGNRILLLKFWEEVHTDTCINLRLPSPSCHLPPPPPYSAGDRPPPLTSSPLSLFSTSTRHHSTLDLPGMLRMSLVSSIFVCDRSTSQCFPTA